MMTIVEEKNINLSQREVLDAANDASNVFLKILEKADALLLNSLYLYCYIYLNSVGISNTYLDPHVYKPLCYTPQKLERVLELLSYSLKEFVG